VQRREAPLAPGAGGTAWGRRRFVGNRRVVAAGRTGLGVARSALHGWRAAVPLDGMPPEVAAALSSPAGARWLQRLVVAMHLVVTLRAGAGVRLVCELLTLSRLSEVVGASYGSQCAVNVQVQEAVVGQAQELRAACDRHASRLVGASPTVALGRWGHLGEGKGARRNTRCTLMEAVGYPFRSSAP
jgi:hypothetical protein